MIDLASLYLIGMAGGALAGVAKNVIRNRITRNRLNTKVWNDQRNKREYEQALKDYPELRLPFDEDGIPILPTEWCGHFCKAPSAVPGNREWVHLPRGEHLFLTEKPTWEDANARHQRMLKERAITYLRHNPEVVARHQNTGYIDVQAFDGQNIRRIYEYEWKNDCRCFECITNRRRVWKNVEAIDDDVAW